MAASVIVFEGGPDPRDTLGSTIAQLRRAVALDTLENWASVPGVGRVVLATNNTDLANAARQLAGVPVEIWETGGAPFHFGRELHRLVDTLGLEQVIYLGGAALPSLQPREMAWVVQTLAEHPRCVVMNNVQSADLVAWRPGDAIGQIPPPANDNFFGNLLREVGLERLLMPNSGAVHFDLDTPTDYLVFEVSGRAGQRAAQALAGLPWPRQRLQQALAVLRRPLAEVGLIGRVGTAVQEHINRNLRLRLRVFSEERGMKALGREQAGAVRSVVAHLIDDLGPRRFFRHLSSVCDVIFFDTRVLFAHGGRQVSEHDRFCSDLGDLSAIGDPWVREITAAASECGVPVMLGGHSVVTGGLWVLAEMAAPAHAFPGAPSGAGPIFTGPSGTC